MEVILTTDVPDLGDKGDIVDVADGYARNFLLPKRKAVAATAGAVRQAESLAIVSGRTAMRKKVT